MSDHEDQTWTDDEVHARLQHVLGMQANAFGWVLLKSGMAPFEAAKLLHETRERFNQQMDEFLAAAQERHDRGDCGCHNHQVDEAEVAALTATLDDELVQILQAPAPQAKEEPHGDD